MLNTHDKPSNATPWNTFCIVLTKAKIKVNVYGRTYWQFGRIEDQKNTAEPR